MGKLILVLFLTLGTSYAQSVGVRVSNGKPQPGETIYLEYTYPTKPKDMPKTFWSYMASIRLDGRYYYNGLHSYVYEIKTFQAGMLRIPAFYVQSEGRQVQAPNVEVPIGVQNVGK